MVDEILASPIDLTVDEVMKTDPEKLTYPRTKEEAYARWESASAQ